MEKFTKQNKFERPLDAFTLTPASIIEFCCDVGKRVTSGNKEIEITLFHRRTKTYYRITDPIELAQDNELPHPIALSSISITAGNYLDEPRQEIEIGQPSISPFFCDEMSRFRLSVRSDDEVWNAGILDLTKRFLFRYRTWYYLLFRRIIAIPIWVTYAILLLAVVPFMSVQFQFSTFLRYGSALVVGPVFPMMLLLSAKLFGILFPSGRMLKSDKRNPTLQQVAFIATIVIAVCAVAGLFWGAFS